MNPFDFDGPDFLVFYLIFGILVLYFASRMRKARESGPPPQLPLNDPYLLAFLGGGRQGVIRTGLVSLIDQGVLMVSEERMVGRGPKWSEQAAHNAIEKSILQYVNNPRNLQEMFKEPTLANIAAGYEEKLRMARLLPSAEDITARRWLVAGAIVLLAGVSWTKMTLALERGHQNIGFLILLTIIFVIVAIKLGTPDRTRLGDDFLSSVRGVFSDVKSRARSMRPGSACTDSTSISACGSGYPTRTRMRKRSSSASGRG